MLHYLLLLWPLIASAQSGIHLDLKRIEIAQYPVITTRARVTDSLGHPLTNLLEANFEVLENSITQYPIAVENLGNNQPVDIVIIMNGTGSIQFYLDATPALVRSLADSFATLGIVPYFGLVNYRDLDVPRTADDMGYQLFHFAEGTLTSDVDEFQDGAINLWGCACGDEQDNLLDALHRALTEITFRDGSRRIFISVTNGTHCSRGDCSRGCEAHWTYSEIMDQLIAANVTVYMIAPSDRDMNPCPPRDYWHHYSGPGSFAEVTGGAFADYGASMLDFWPAMALHSFGGYRISYLSGRPIADCNERTVSVIAKVPVTPGGTDTIRLSDDSSYLAPCSPMARILEPLPGSVTSRSNQLIRLVVTAPPPIRLDSMQFVLVVAGTPYTIGPNLTWQDSILTFFPPTHWVDGQVVAVTLAQALTTAGYGPLSGPLSWTFRVDLSRRLKSPRWYDLLGRKVDSKDVKAGIYLQGKF